VDDRGPHLLDRRVEPFNALPKLREPRLVERLIDPAVHPVAGEHDVGPGQPEHPFEPFGKIGPGKPSAGVPLLGKPRHRLAREAAVDHLGLEPLVLHPGDEVGHPAAVVGD